MIMLFLPLQGHFYSTVCRSKVIFDGLKVIPDWLKITHDMLNVTLGAWTC